MSFTKNDIQAATTAAAGYLVGSHVPTFDCKHYAKVLRQHPKLINYEIACFKRNIKNTPNEILIKGKEVQGIMLEGAAITITDLRKILKSIFNKTSFQNRMNLPEGRLFRFVDVISDKKARPPTARKQRRFREARCKQANFLACTTFTVVLGISDLDLAVDLGTLYGIVTV